MKSAERDSKLKRGLKAYADSVEAGGTLTGFRNRLRNWPMYAAAAGSALALSTSATADIIGQGGLDTRTVSFGGDRFSVGFQGSHLYTRHGTPFGGIVVSTRSYGRVNLSRNGLTSPVNEPALPRSYSINSRASFPTPPGLLLEGRFSRFFSISLGHGFPTSEYFRRGTRTGFWAPNGTAYAPIKLTNGDLGFLKIAVASNGNGVPVGADILAWAYNDVAGQPIMTQPVPEPSTLSLGLLAIGAGGVLAFRRRRNAAASQPAESVK